MLTKFSRYCVAALATLALSACGGSYSRGIFEGYVTGLTEEATIAKVGKPDVVFNTDAKQHRFVYKGRTFDSNGNGLKDNEATIYFEKNAAGEFVAMQFAFN